MKLAKHDKQEQGAVSTQSNRWSPLQQLHRLHDQIDRLFEQPFGMWSATPMAEACPDVDVYETNDRLVIKADLPGMKKEDINLSMSDNVLSISGERKEETEHKEGNSYMSERCFGSFQRSITLPSSVRADKINAEYKDGILTVTCPKGEVSQSKQIDVKFD